MDDLMYLPKYSMTVEDNILWAKRNLIDSIWKSANREGIAVTYPDTQVICEGMSVAGYSIEEINAVHDLIVPMTKAFRSLLPLTQQA